MNNKTKTINTLKKLSHLYPSDIKCFKSFLFGLIKYSRIGTVSVLEVIGFSVFEKVGDKYSLFGMVIR